MNDLMVGEHDVLSFLKPDTLLGALVYLVVFLFVAMLLSRTLRTVVHAAMTRKGHIDRTTISFMQQFGTALIWVIVLILYAHLIPVLRSMGTALLAGASIASVVIGLAAQSTLGNLVAGHFDHDLPAVPTGRHHPGGGAHGHRDRRGRNPVTRLHDTAHG